MQILFRAAGFTAVAITLGVTAAFASPAPALQGGTFAAQSLSKAAAADQAEGIDQPTPFAQAVADTVPTTVPTVGVTPPAPVTQLEEAEDAPRGRSLAEMVRDYSGSSAPAQSDISTAEFDCLAGAVYYESKGEPLAGQLTVAEVVLNRASSGRFPTSICGVVRQPSQFSFVRGGRIPAAPRASAAWRTAVAIAHIAVEDLANGSAPRALFFHARRVSPGWRNLTRVATVGNHIFYR